MISEGETGACWEETVVFPQGGITTTAFCRPFTQFDVFKKRAATAVVNIKQVFDPSHLSEQQQSNQRSNIQ